MESFKEAMLKGLAAAKVSLDNLKEIDILLRDFSSTVAENSQSAAEVHIEDTELMDKIHIPFDKQGSWQRTIFLAEPAKPDSSEREQYKIAFLSTTENGYPCTLTYRSQSQQALDAVSLSGLLSELLQAPSTGRIILHFMGKKARG